MKKMEYTEFGKTQLRVSRMCLGTWGIGGAGWDSYSDESRMDAIKAAVDCGINFIDTAPAYNGGRAEQYIGEVVHKLGVRKEVILATKCGNEFINGKYVRCGSADKIMRECEESLRNLKTDYIDVYLVHWPDPNVPMEETMDALNTLKKQGKILHIGVSNFTKEQIEEAEKYCAIEAYQPQYSMVDRKWEQLIRWACAQKMGVMTYGTLGGGILTGKYRELKEYGVDDNRNRFYPYFKEPLFSKVMLLLRTMDQISVERNVPLSQIALNWTLQRTFISSCIIGAQSRDKIEENCKVFEWKLSDDEMQLLEQALKKTII